MSKGGSRRSQMTSNSDRSSSAQSPKLTWVAGLRRRQIGRPGPPPAPRGIAELVGGILEQPMPRALRPQRPMPERAVPSIETASTGSILERAT